MLSEVLEAPQRETQISTDAVDVSVVVYVDSHLENAGQMYASVAQLLKQERQTFEFIFIDDGTGPGVQAMVEALHEFAEDVRVVRLPRFYGMSVAMMAGFGYAKGRLILTLGSFLQVHPSEISKMLRKIEEGYDLVNGWRVNRVDRRLNQWHTRAYNWMVRKVADVTLHDTNCTLKLFKRSAVAEISVYGDNYRFLPVLAARRGFRVAEVQVRQRREINTIGVYGAGVYLRRLLDLMTLMFTGRFVERPLRFFGSLGVVLFGSGLLINLYLVYVKYLMHQAISQRPLLILGTLCMVIGVQSGSLGLIGELILFTHSRDIQSYQVEKVLETR